MAQEVQTTLDYKADLNLIEGVGHQENKVREHTQVEAAFGYECSLSGSASIHGEGGVQAPPVQVSINLDSMDGPTEFKAVSGGVRIPLAGPYLAHMEFAGGSTNFTLTHMVKVDGEVLEQLNTNSNSYSVVEKVINLGKYNVLQLWESSYYNASPGYGSSAWAYFKMTLKKL